MATDNNFKHFVQGINLVPNTSSLAASPGDIDYDTTSGQFNFYLASGSAHGVTDSGTQTLTNKTIDVSDNNIVGTVNTAAQFDVSTGNLESSLTTATELGYVHGVTSNIQTQLNSKQGSLTFADSLVDSAGTVTLVNDSATPGNSKYYGTNSSGTLGYFSITSPLTFSDSVVNTAGNVTLVNDSATPGNSKYYGTNGSGTLGYYAISAGSVTAVTGSGNIASSGGSTPNITFTGTLGPSSGGTGQTSLSAAFNALNPMTTTGDLIYEVSTGVAARLGIGTVGEVLTVNGSGVPAWMAAPGTVSAFFASSEVTTDSTAISSTSFSTFDNSPAFTFTPTVTGTYKVHSSASMVAVGDGLGFIRIFNTSGGATLLYENQASCALISVAGTPEVYTSGYTESFYTLTAGTSYVFDIQGKVGTAIEVVLTGASGNPFYMFAELEVTASGPAAGFFASSQVTTQSSPNTSTSFATYSNSPAFTFTPTVSGTYKIYSLASAEEADSNQTGVLRIFNTSGSATLLYENQGLIEVAPNDLVLQTTVVQSVYTLTAGTAYQFDIQGKTSGGAGGTYLRGDLAPFYMFAEQVGGAISGGGGSGANTSLSNLTSVAINTDVLPDATSNARNLGLSGFQWANIWGENIEGTVRVITPLVTNLTSPLELTGSTIQLNGTTTIGGSAAVHSINTTFTTGSGTATFTNVPGSAGNPAGYIEIKVNGTTSYIPYFQ